MTDYDLILGLKSKACVNGVRPETISTIEGNIADMTSTLEELGTTLEGVADDVSDNATAIGGLDTRVTALENATPTTLRWTFKPYAEWDELFDDFTNLIQAKHSIRIMYYYRTGVENVNTYAVLSLAKGDFIRKTAYNKFISRNDNDDLVFMGVKGSFIIDTSVSTDIAGIQSIRITTPTSISFNTHNLTKSDDMSRTGADCIAIAYLND